MPPRGHSARGMRDGERKRTLCQRGREPQLAPLFPQTEAMSLADQLSVRNPPVE
jgi:hypothetical protein